MVLKVSPMKFVLMMITMTLIVKEILTMKVRVGMMTKIDTMAMLICFLVLFLLTPLD